MNQPQRIAIVILLLAYGLMPIGLVAFNVTTSSSQTVCGGNTQVGVFCLIVHNDEDRDVQFQCHAELPCGWVCLDEQSAFWIGPDETLPVLMAIQAPAETPAGTYSLAFFFEEERTLTPLAVVESVFAVAQKVELGVEVEGLPPFVAEGDACRLVVHLKNRGNVPLPLNFAISSEPNDFILTMDCPSLELLPGDDEDLAIEVQTSVCAGGSRECYLFFSVCDGQSEELYYQQTLRLERVPRGLIPVDSYVKLPGQFRVMGAHNNCVDMIGAEMAAGGIVNINRMTSIDLVLRNPSDPRNVLYGQDQRFYLGVFDPVADAVLGDTVYSLSPLILPARYGRGVGADIHSDGWGAGAYYVREVIQTDIHDREMGAYISRELWPWAWLTVNYARRNIPLTQVETTLLQKTYPIPYHEAPIGSVSLELEPLPYTAAVIEVRKDFGEYMGQKGRLAYFLGLDGLVFGDTHYYVQSVDSPRYFHGFYRDTKILNYGLDTPIYTVPNLRLTSSYFNNQQGVALDPYLPVVVDGQETGAVTPPIHGYQWTRQIANLLNYTFTENRGRFAIGTYFLRGEDTPVLATFNFRQHWAGLQWGWNTHCWSLGGRSYFGNQHNLLENTKQHGLQQHSVNANWTFSDTLSTRLLYEWGNLNYYDILPIQNTLTLAVDRRLSCDSWAQAFAAMNWRDYKNSQQVQLYGQQEVHLGASLTHVFANGHRAHCNAQCFISKQPRNVNTATEIATTAVYRYRDLAANRFECFLSYDVPLAVPIARRQDIGSLYGQVINHGTGTPVVNAVLNLGGEGIMSDRNGRFIVEGLCPGDYSVQILCPVVLSHWRRRNRVP